MAPISLLDGRYCENRAETPITAGFARQAVDFATAYPEIP
jgi:hypothetical protein